MIVPKKRTMSYASAAEAALKLNPRRPPPQVGQRWFWTLAFGEHEDRTPTRGYEPTRKAAMAAFATKLAAGIERGANVQSRTIGSRQMAWGFEIGRIYNGRIRGRVL